MQKTGLQIDFPPFNFSIKYCLNNKVFLLNIKFDRRVTKYQSYKVSVTKF